MVQRLIFWLQRHRLAVAAVVPPPSDALLLATAKEIEAIILRDAVSLAAYADPRTLKLRVQDGYCRVRAKVYPEQPPLTPMAMQVLGSLLTSPSPG